MEHDLGAFLYMLTNITKNSQKEPSEVGFWGRREGVAGEALGTSNGELMMAAINRFALKAGG